MLPILFGERIVGRLDPKADRKTRIFCVRQLAFEPGVDNADGLIPELCRVLSDLARFNGCRTVLLENVQPKKFVAPLKNALVPGMGG